MRLHCIDAFRVYAIFIIVCAHIQFFGGLNHEGVAKLFELGWIIGARWTMPFFFIVSGYFVGGKIVEEPSKAKPIAIRYTKKLAVIFLCWWAIYAVVDPEYFFHLLEEEPIRLIFEGTRVHLWFLVSLILTVWLFALWPLNGRSKYFLLFGGVLYVCGLLGGSYQVTPLGFDIHFNTRSGVFFSTLFFAIGVAFHNKLPRVSRLAAACIAFVGLAIFCLEAYYFKVQWSVRPIEHDYLLGTIPFGVGVFLLAFAHHDSNIDRFVSQYARYVLGIYLSHLLFVDLLRPFGTSVQPIVWQFMFPIFVFGASLVFAITLSRTFLRRLVV